MNREEMIRRLDAGEDPLEVSIVKWEEERDMCDEDNVLDISPGTCALCHTQPIPRSCLICVIRNYTGLSGCIGTPYSDYVCNPTKHNAGRMVMFLKSLREE